MQDLQDMETVPGPDMDQEDFSSKYPYSPYPQRPRLNRRHSFEPNSNNNNAGLRTTLTKKTIYQAPDLNDQGLGQSSSNGTIAKDRSFDHTDNPVVGRKTLYCVRHGEALHNIEERRAKETAADTAAAQGIEKGTRQYEEILEKARKQVLQVNLLCTHRA